MLTIFRTDSQGQKNETVTPLFSKPRMMLSAGESAAITADQYLKFASSIVSTSTFGYNMHRSGSIIGLSLLVHVAVKITDGTVTLEARKNGASVFSIVTDTITTTGDFGKTGSQVPGVDTFVAGDLLTLFVDFTSLVGTITGIVAFMELELDS